ncbi:YcxB family protein [Calycomorphotria hydatis]|uniref:YcxB-like C-terminal domain-containing protein n=1 Tax=Calycomorphotria hydatis TaxID=2528027 RepID=A0A517T5L4_9PLAN|nr:YcxB family protein [Calycomorphotria hydatis]QDT63672.1 hypothetical protein V22_08960 [Calycomorphotria hydatis]
MITLAYEQTIDDLVALQRHFLKQSKLRKPRRWLGYLIIALLVLLSTLLTLMYLITLVTPVRNGNTSPQELLLYAAILCLVAAAVFSLFVVLPFRMYFIRKQFERMQHTNANPTMTGPRTVTVTEETFKISGDGFLTEYRWDLLRGVIRTNQYLFVVQTLSSAYLQAYVVPLRAFEAASPDALDQFLKFAAEHNVPMLSERDSI